MIPDFRRLATATIAAVVFASPLRAQVPGSLSDSAWGRLSVALSEPPGYFDTDNLISNEDSYLHVVGTLKRLGVTGGAFIGVGPDQSFSYIAAVRPAVAFLLDIRRDNLLEHVLFKSLFSLSRNRLEYLCLLFGKRAPADTAGWGARDIAALLAYTDAAPKSASVAAEIQSRVIEATKKLAIPLNVVDFATVARFHATFIAEGPSLRFNSLGRPPASYDPDLRRLLTETDRTGRQSSYLAHEADFQFLKSLEAHNLVVPVVGNLAGPKALAAIGSWIKDHGATVSAFYTSNVEQYLFGDGSFDRFSRTVIALPRSPQSVMIRSYFSGGHPQTVTGYHAVQLLQYMDRFSAAEASSPFQSYYDLVTREVIPP